jgi:hypothetical protein
MSRTGVRPEVVVNSPESGLFQEKQWNYNHQTTTLGGQTHGHFQNCCGFEINLSQLYCKL